MGDAPNFYSFLEKVNNLKTSHKLPLKKHCRGLVKIKNDGFQGTRVIVSRDPIKRNIDGVDVWPYEDFLKHMWANY